MFIATTHYHLYWHNSIGTELLIALFGSTIAIIRMRQCSKLGVVTFGLPHTRNLTTLLVLCILI